MQLRQVPLINTTSVSAKKTFVLRLDEATYKAIEKWASDEFRSVNGQLEYIIDKALKEAKRKKQSQADTPDDKIE